MRKTIRKKTIEDFDPIQFKIKMNNKISERLGKRYSIEFEHFDNDEEIKHLENEFVAVYSFFWKALWSFINIEHV